MVKKAGPIDRYIGKKIKLKRIQLRLSQANLGNFLGVSFQQIQKYESGSNRIPVSRLYKLVKVFNLGLDYFFDGFDGEVK